MSSIHQYSNCKYHVPNIEPHKYIKQILTKQKGEINSNTIISGDNNTPLLPMDRSSRQKINKKIVNFNTMPGQLGGSVS